MGLKLGTDPALFGCVRARTRRVARTLLTENFNNHEIRQENSEIREMYPEAGYMGYIFRKRGTKRGTRCGA